MAEAVIGDVEYGALRNPALNAVLKKFGSIAFKRCSVMMEFEHFLRKINAGGGTCLEIGTYHGISAIVLSQYFDRVICVSVDDDPSRLLKQQIADFLGITNIRFFDVRENQEKRDLIDQFDFDFCYQDGNHSQDTYDDFDLVKRCGRVLFHEYWPIQPSVWNLVNLLPADEITRAQFDCFAYWRAAGVLHRPLPRQPRALEVA